MRKRFLCLLLAAMLLVAAVPKAEAVIYITNPDEVNGYDYSDEYGDVLTAIFRGELAMFSNTSDTFPLGSSLNNSKAYYIAGNRFGGYQCYIYAQAVYYHLFGDIPHHGNGSISWSNSKRVLFNEPEAYYELFINSDIGFGAYIRTTVNEDGSYSGNGHSMIVLDYDEEGITYLEGNANGRGLIRITKRTWEDYNYQQLSSRGRRIAFVAQCKSTMCRHDFDIVGYCNLCYRDFNFAGTLNTESAGSYQIKTEDGACIYLERPYEDSLGRTELLPKGTRLEVHGIVRNAADELWYQVGYEGMVGYTPVYTLAWLELGDQQITCEITSPAQGQTVPRASFPVIGTVTSRYPLAKIEAWLDGQLYATVDPNGAAKVDLRATDVNYKLNFAALEPGRHTLTILAQDVHHELQTVCERRFYSEVAEAEGLPGDCDSNGELTTDDAVYLLLHVMFGGEDYPITEGETDLNGDGGVSTDDAVYLLLHVMFGAADYPLP